MWYVLVVGLSNLTLGIGIAVILQRRLQHGLAQLQRLEEHQASQPENRVFEEPEREIKLCTKPRPRKESKPVEDQPLTTGLEAAKLPSAWQSLVSQNAFGSPVLAAAEMLQKHCGQTTAQLTESDSVIQAGGLNPDQQREMLRLLNETVASTKDRCDEIASQFNEHGFEFQSLSKAAIRLEANTSRVALDLSSSLKELQKIDASSNVEALIKKWHYRFATINHALRDISQMALADIAAANGTLSQLTELERIDTLSGLENAFGFFETLEKWKVEDPSAERPTSFVLFDVNLSGQHNEKLGFEMYDQLLASLGRLLGENVRQTRGFDRVFRIGGQAFVAFLGDTPGRAGATAADRLRQIVANCDFRRADQNFQITCNTATTALDSADTLESILDRLHEAMGQSKQQGVNQNALMLKGDCTVFEPQEREVQQLVVEF